MFLAEDDEVIETVGFDRQNKALGREKGTRLISVAADGSSIVQTYDADDRVTQAVWYNPSHSVIDTQNKSYDNDGDLLTASNVNGTYSFSYDPDNCVTQVSEPFGQTLNYAYDGDGNQTQVVDSFGGTQTSYYDVQDRLVTRDYTGEGQTLRVDFLYTPDGQIAQQTDYDSLSGPASPGSLVAVTGYSFDADENVTAVLSTDASTATIEQFVYTLDRAGNVSSEVDTQGGTPTTTSYSYDDANQLTGAGGSSYNYDANGNRDSSGYTTTLGNEMTSDGTYNYTYDAKGNEITKTDIATGDKWTYGYNNANEMVSAVETTSGSVVEKSLTYEYDVFGNRTEVDVTVGMTTTTTRYAYDMWNPAKAGATGTANSDIWATFTSGGSLITRQLQGDGVDQHLAYVTSSNAYWYLTDHLNSIRAVINNSGAVQDSIIYDAYGNITYQTPSPATTPLYFYTGREFDVETDLQYNRARYYDATTGRWISQDPMGFNAGDSNLYRYVNNRPTVATDPSGMMIGIQILILPYLFSPPEWPPHATYYYRDPWVIKKQGEFKDMITATVRAQITRINEQNRTYMLRIRISSEVPAQKATNPLVTDGMLPAGVNLRTETFLRALDGQNRPLPGKATLDFNFTPRPMAQDVEVNPGPWLLPPTKDLGKVENIVWVVSPDKARRASVATIEVLLPMPGPGLSAVGSGKIEIKGIETDATGKPLPLPMLPMRPVYLRWGLDFQSRSGFITMEQRGEPFIEK